MTVAFWLPSGYQKLCKALFFQRVAGWVPGLSRQASSPTLTETSLLKQQLNFENGRDSGCLLVALSRLFL